MSRNVVACLDLGNRVGASQLEQTGCRKGEKDEIDGHNVVEDLFIASGNGDDDGKYTLKDDRGDRHLGFPIQRTDRFKEETILRHSVIHTRSRQNALTEK